MSKNNQLSSLAGTVLNADQYQKLVANLQSIITQNIAQAEEFARHKAVLTHWQIGKEIADLNLRENANYHSSILADLAADLQMNKNTLSRSVQFFKQYPAAPQSSSLTWSHYKILIAIKYPNLRLTLEEKSKKEGWNVAKLTQAVKTPDQFLLGSPEDGAQNDPSHQQSATTSHPQIARPTKPNYLYWAQISNVVDGDTLVMNIDLGFNVIKKQRVRLAQIDAPEMGTDEGKKSYRFLRDLAANLGWLVIRTNKIDIYGRYLADVFYLNKEGRNKGGQIEVFEQGVYLNESLAVVFSAI
jgi:endonuclease YncB( thermonuclease family)